MKAILTRTGGFAALVLFLVLWLPAARAGERVLFDFERGFDFSAVRTSDATATETRSAAGSALRVRTGHAQKWPGVTLVAPGPEGRWDLSRFGEVEARVRNLGDSRLTVHGRVDDPGADGTKHCVTASLTLGPGAAGALRVALKRTSDDTLGGRLFGLRGYPAAWGGPGTVDATNVTRILFFVSQPAKDQEFEVDDIRAAGSWTPPTAWGSDAVPFFPLIDPYGQYRHKDWPGKVHSLAELKERREREKEELRAAAGPAQWDRYGGWAAGPQLEASGFFRVAKHAGQWWLVDPDGRLFWSHGIDCVRMMDGTVIEEREHWFEDFPGARPEFAEFIMPHARVLKGHYQGRAVRGFSFAGANLKRKYGAEWKQTLGGLIHERLRSWGLNTIGNWSEEGVRRLRRTPYTDSVTSREAILIEGSEGYWGKFPDVFDASFRDGLRRSMAGKKGQSAGDPWCLGYFSDNEMSWGDELSLAVASLRSPEPQPAKREFIAELRARHGEIVRLNEAWGTAHASWEALAASRTAPDLQRARPDLAAFTTRLAETYFQTVREVIKETAPRQLYLGCRFAWANPRAAAAAAKFCDVVSYNLYQRGVGDFRCSSGADVPLLIGEFHFGALDRGMFHTGLVPVANQAARAETYRSYVESALRHPQFVGCHWFQYQDEPTTGRVYDEENYQIGFVDIADTPYAETIAASREVGARLYALRLEAGR